MENSKKLDLYMWFWTFMLLLASFVAAIYSHEGLEVFHNFYLLLITPSKLVTDYYMIGGLGASFLNAGLCGLACNLIILLTKTKSSSLTLAGYFLVIAHCFYGLNLLNMWPPFLGIVLYGLIKKEHLGEHVHLGFFATSLGPFISEFIFRYTNEASFVFGEVHINITGCIIVVIFSIMAGIAIPALMPGTTKMSKGYNLYKAGLAIGLFGFFANGLFFKTFGIENPPTFTLDNFTHVNSFYAENNHSFILFVDIFYVLIFLLSLLIGFLCNAKSFKNYKMIWLCDGWDDDFVEKTGFGNSLINIGLYGLTLLVYYNILIIASNLLNLPSVGFTGPTTGAIIAAITFSASGQTIRNVWSIAAGYIAFYFTYFVVCKICGLEAASSLASQIYLSSFAFATGLCPFAGRYGIGVGMLAGVIDAVICTSTSAIHGGFVLYNGGFTAGLTALLLLPLLDFYKKTPLEEVD